MIIINFMKKLKVEVIYKLQYNVFKIYIYVHYN